MVVVMMVAHDAQDDSNPHAHDSPAGHTWTTMTS